MLRRQTAAVAARTLGAGLSLAVLVRPVAAHEVAGARFDAPLPLPLLFVGAAATVALTALSLAVTDRRPNTAWPTGRLPLATGLDRAGRVVLAPLFLLAVAAAVFVGMFGRQVAAENAATVFTWPVWFHGLALVAITAGSPWRLLSPWRTVYRALVRLEGQPVSLWSDPPAALVEWPALAGFVVLFGIVENLTGIPSSPRSTAVVVAGYAAVMLGGALAFGEAWLDRADPLGVLYRLFGRVAPFGVTRETGSVTVNVRPPWRSCRRPVSTVALAAFVVATVYTVSFDGFTSTTTYLDIRATIRGPFGPGPAPFLLYGLGLGVFLATFVGASALAERLGRDGEARSRRAVTRTFAPTVLPIAAGYEVAHYYPTVLRNLGQLWALAVRPVVPSADPLALTGWLTLPVFWWSQVFLVVGGHVVAVVAAHLAAVDRYDPLGAARRAHLPLVAVMVAYTVLSLWIISQPVVR